MKYTFEQGSIPHAGVWRFMEMYTSGHAGFGKGCAPYLRARGHPL